MPNTVYYKRYRMERPLDNLPPVPPLPAGMIWLPWSPGLLDAHADTKYASFRAEVDAVVFPSLASEGGCVGLMHRISGGRTFCPQATWLVAGPAGFCGTVQGLLDRGVGAIQNLGVPPEYRGLGLGTALLVRALHGFKAARARLGLLEVTACNEGAMRLYRRYGFKATRTLYRPVEAQTSVMSLL